MRRNRMAQSGREINVIADLFTKGSQNLSVITETRNISLVYYIALLKSHKDKQQISILARQDSGRVQEYNANLCEEATSRPQRRDARSRLSFAQPFMLNAIYMTLSRTLRL